MKIAVLAIRDTGGTAYTLAHAINNVQKEHQAISVRGINNYINYPTHVEMSEYKRVNIRDIAYKADVLVFLGFMQPFFDTLHLQKNKLKDKKKILLCMGSEWRYGRVGLKEQANRLLGKYRIVLGGADLFLPIEFEHPDTHVKTNFEAVEDDEAEYLPVVRSMDELARSFGMCNQDCTAINVFEVPKTKVVFTHAPTSESNKGSVMFYRVATRAQQLVRNMTFRTIKNQPWHTTLNRVSSSDALYDQAPPFPTAYGALSVEAGIFKVPSFSQIYPDAQRWIKRKTGLDTPYITFCGEEDLLEKTIRVASDERVRRYFGELNYEYCKALHDEKPVVERFLKIVEAM